MNDMERGVRRAGGCFDVCELTVRYVNEGHAISVSHTIGERRSAFENPFHAGHSDNESIERYLDDLQREIRENIHPDHEAHIREGLEARAPMDEAEHASR